jgi:hypothetical protein
VGLFKRNNLKNTLSIIVRKKQKLREILQHLQKFYYQMQFSEQTNPGHFIDRVREIKNQSCKITQALSLDQKLKY